MQELCSLLVYMYVAECLYIDARTMSIAGVQMLQNVYTLIVELCPLLVYKYVAEYLYIDARTMSTAGIIGTCKKTRSTDLD